MALENTARIALPNHPGIFHGRNKNMKSKSNDGVTPESLAHTNGDLAMVSLPKKFRIGQAAWSRFLSRMLVGKIGDAVAVVDAFTFGE